jgi:hypothetical protein
MQRRLKNAEAPMREMQEGCVREIREVREMQDACDKKAQRALAAILEVSVEFADAQRRLEKTEVSMREKHVAPVVRPDGLP